MVTLMIAETRDLPASALLGLYEAAQFLKGQHQRLVQAAEHPDPPPPPAQDDPEPDPFADRW